MRKFNFFVIVAVIFIIAAGCSSKEPVQKSSEEWLKDGIAYFQKKKYSKAAEALENAVIEAETPEIAAQAQLLLGDSYFFLKDYEQAIPSYKEYLNIYPDSPDAKRAMYRLGLSYYNQIDTVDRDMSNTEEAIKVFSKILEKYPDFAKEKGLDKKVVEMRNMLAEKEFYVAKFYFRIKEPQPAIKRLEYILANYKDTKIYPEAVLTLAEYEVNDPAKAQQVANLLTDLAKSKDAVNYLSKISSVLAQLEKNLDKANR